MLCVGYVVFVLAYKFEIRSSLEKAYAYLHRPLLCYFSESQFTPTQKILHVCCAQSDSLWKVKVMQAQRKSDIEQSILG